MNERVFVNVGFVVAPLQCNTGEENMKTNAVMGGERHYGCKSPTKSHDEQKKTCQIRNKIAIYRDVRISGFEFDESF